VEQPLRAREPWEFGASEKLRHDGFAEPPYRWSPDFRLTPATECTGTAAHGDGLEFEHFHAPDVPFDRGLGAAVMRMAVAVNLSRPEDLLQLIDLGLPAGFRGIAFFRR